MNGWGLLTVNPIIKGGGTREPSVVPGPLLKRAVIAFTQGRPTAAEKGFPGPELSEILECESVGSQFYLPVIVVQIVGILVIQPFRTWAHSK